MKTVALIVLLLCLLQPLACYAHPCASCLDYPDTEDTSGKSGNHSHDQDTDSCDSTVCCAEYVNLSPDNTVIYAPLVSVVVTPETFQKLPKIVIPIFVPPQSLV